MINPYACPFCKGTGQTMAIESFHFVYRDCKECDGTGAKLTLAKRETVVDTSEKKRGKR